jgi:hypothetical protein
MYHALVTKQEHSEQDSFIAKRITQAKREIIGGILRIYGGVLGDIPLTVHSFSELHEYCDANELGGLCDDNITAEGNRLFPERTDPGTIATQGWMDASNKIQDRINVWLDGYEHVDLCALITRLMSDEQRQCLLDWNRNDEAVAMLDDLESRVGYAYGFTPVVMAQLRTLVDEEVQ